MTEACYEQRDPSVDNPVASFGVGIVTMREDWVGICIKFAMYDRTHKLTHWSPEAFHKLIGALPRWAYLATSRHISRRRGALMARSPDMLELAHSREASRLAPL